MVRAPQKASKARLAGPCPGLNNHQTRVSITWSLNFRDIRTTMRLVVQIEASSCSATPRPRAE